MDMGGEAKGRDEVPPKLDGMGDELFFDLHCHTRVLQSKWSRLFSSPSTTETTALSPMHFAHNTTGCARYASYAGTTLQMYAIRLDEIKHDLELEWPMDVYGMVAARDAVDGKRNIVFLRQRHNCQTLTEKDPCLHLTGPSRAIVFLDLVFFDIELKVKGRTKSEDRVLVSGNFKYNGRFWSSLTHEFDYFCQVLDFEKLPKTVQATVVGVRVIGRRRGWPFKHGGRITCLAKGFSESAELEAKHEDSREVVLQDQVRANRSDGYVELSRQVVSVQLGGTLEVVMREWSGSAGFTAHQVHVFFQAQRCKISQQRCYLGHSEVEVTVAWSLLAGDKLAGWYGGALGADSSLPEDDESQGDGPSQDGTAAAARKRTSKIQSATETVRAEIYSYLDLIAERVMKLKPESKLRISMYSSTEIQIHLDDMRSEVTNLLQMMDIVHSMEIQSKEATMEKMGIQIRTEDKGKSAKENFGFDQSILESLELIYTMLLKKQTHSYKEVMQTQDSLMEAKQMGGEAKGRDEVMTEEDCFDQHRRSWVSNWSSLHGSFTETTTISPMHFTHATPGRTPFGAFVAKTLQMCSIKVMEIKDDFGLKWPLEVYGVVAARDTVDRNRNILFSRQRDDCQNLREKDPFLRLTGPSRAIVAEDRVDVEIQLKVKGGRTKNEDRVLISEVWRYNGRICPSSLEGQSCTLVLSAEEIRNSVQATIMSIRVIDQGTTWPFKHGGRVVCSSVPRNSVPQNARSTDSKHIAASTSRQVILQDGAIDVDRNGYIGLSRQVVSVELYGILEVAIYGYSKNRQTAARSCVYMKAQSCNVSRHECCLHTCKMEIEVAWSRLVEDKRCI